MLVELQTILISLQRFPRNVQILNFMTIRQVETPLLQRQTWRTRYFQFLFLRSRLIFWLGFLVSCYRHFMFKSWNGLPNELHGDTFICLQTFYVRRHARGCESRYCIGKTEAGQNIHQLSRWQKFCTWVFLCETRDYALLIAWLI